MKTGTAIQDLFDHLGKPQTPWPEVHPFPIFVPIPTRKPPRIHPMIESSPFATLGSSKRTIFVVV